MYAWVHTCMEGEMVREMVRERERGEKREEKHVCYKYTSSLTVCQSSGMQAFMSTVAMPEWKSMKTPGCWARTDIDTDKRACHFALNSTFVQILAFQLIILLPTTREVEANSTDWQNSRRLQVKVAKRLRYQVLPTKDFFCEMFRPAERSKEVSQARQLFTMLGAPPTVPAMLSFEAHLPTHTSYKYWSKCAQTTRHKKVYLQSYIWT